MNDLAEIADRLVTTGKGILAADETVPTLSKRFEALQIPSTPDTRRDYRELLLTTMGAAEFISGVILHDETVRQLGSGGEPIVEICNGLGIVPGIKVDAGAKTLAGHAPERVTEGLDGLRQRLAEYRRRGLRFAKWRAVLDVNHSAPSRICVTTNADALARYAALCQEQDLLPIVEPEVLMDGPHSIERCAQVTEAVLHAVFSALFEHGVNLEAMLLKPNMVISGDTCPRQASVSDVATATLRCLRRHVPPAVPGVVFLSGGQRDVLATQHLDAIHRLSGDRQTPWKLSFSYGRALQDAAMSAWRGKRENVEVAQRAFHHRARCNSLATLGAYSTTAETMHAGHRAPSISAEWSDD